MTPSTARANANIAFIKYWGNRDHDLRLPVSPSLSMNLDGLYAETQVAWSAGAEADKLVLNGETQQGPALARVSQHLSRLRERFGLTQRAHVTSINNFPMGAGIASSAAAFAALTLAAVHAAGITDVSERELSTLARLGSGSAARSIPDGFVAWYVGTDHATSYAESIAPPDHWDLVDVIAVVSQAHKATGSTAGHRSADSSVLQAARVASAQARYEACLSALLARDFDALAAVVEEDSTIMHAIMMTSRPPLFYWLPPSLAIMEAVRAWRTEGLRVFYTLDAGPNVHCICIKDDAEVVRSRLQAMSGVIDVLRAAPGPGARIL